MLTPGTVLILTPEKPAAGGRMLARHDGQVVLVAGAIPGETARVRVDRAERSVVWASVVDVVEPHPDRRAVSWDARCGGAAYAHISYESQLRLKADVIREALVRIGRHPWSEAIAVAGSPEYGYRMRARLHARRTCPGFFLEGTHTVCDPSPTGQLLAATVETVAALGAALGRAGLDVHADLDVSENIGADQRSMHVAFGDEVRPDALSTLSPVPGATGLSWSDVRRPGAQLVFGDPWVEEALRVGDATILLRRHVRAFFQGNRYLLPHLVSRVHASCPDGAVVDLYAGAGLFAVTLAASGRRRVTAVEGDAFACADLRANAERAGGAVEVRAVAVERFVAGARALGPGTLILDPPRTGMTREAAEGAVRLGASRVVFVSCDVATFARDVRRFVDAGYRLVSLEGLDLFPNTPHVEVLALLDRG